MMFGDLDFEPEPVTFELPKRSAETPRVVRSSYVEPGVAYVMAGRMFEDDRDRVFVSMSMPAADAAELGRILDDRHGAGDRIGDARVLDELTKKARAVIEARLIVDVLRDRRMQYNDEADLQAEIAAALEGVDLPARREVVLSDGSSRIDLLAGRVGIEVKVAGARDVVDRQLARYAKCEEISALVLVTTRAAHGVGSYELEGVPVLVCSLIGAGL